MCLVGDFNAKHCGWLLSQATDSSSIKLWSFAAANGLFQVVTKPTFTVNSGQTVLLDLMFLNQVCNVKSVGVLNPLAGFSPTVVALASKATRDRKSFVFMRPHDGADFDALRCTSMDVDRSYIERCSDVDAAVSLSLCGTTWSTRCCINLYK